jgi:hypothetical protein
MFSCGPYVGDRAARPGVRARSVAQNRALPPMAPLRNVPMALNTGCFKRHAAGFRHCLFLQVQPLAAT